MSAIEFQKVLEIEQIQIVRDLAIEIWHEHFTSIIGLAQVEYMLDKFQSKVAIIQQIESGFYYYLISEQNENLGYLAIKFIPGKLFLSKLYVKSSFRGKGYGKLAIQFLIQLARPGGLQVITLSVNKDNFKALKAYQKMGFEIINAKIEDIGGGFVMDDYEMEIRLSTTNSTI